MLTYRGAQGASAENWNASINLHFFVTALFQAQTATKLGETNYLILYKPYGLQESKWPMNPGSNIRFTSTDPIISIMFLLFKHSSTY